MDGFIQIHGHSTHTHRSAQCDVTNAKFAYKFEEKKYSRVAGFGQSRFSLTHSLSIGGNMDRIFV